MVSQLFCSVLHSLFWRQGLPFSNVATSGQPVQRALGTVSYLRRDCVGVRLKGKIGEDGSSITYDFDEEEGSTSSTLRDATEWLTLCEQQED